MADMRTVTVDADDEGGWRVVVRDQDMMPVDEKGGYATKPSADRAAAQKRYALKTRRPVERRPT